MLGNFYEPSGFETIGFALLLLVALSIKIFFWYCVFLFVRYLFRMGRKLEHRLDNSLEDRDRPLDVNIRLVDPRPATADWDEEPPPIRRR